MKRYINLSTHSNYTQMETVVTPAEIVEFAVKDGAGAVALTDYNSVNGLLAFSKAAEKHKIKGFKPIYGVQIYAVDTARASVPRIITLLARNQSGLRNLYKIISLGYMKELSERIWPCVSYEDVHQNHDGILVGIVCTKEDVCQQWTSTEETCDREKWNRLVLSEYAIADYVEIRPWRFYAENTGISADEEVPDSARIQHHLAAFVKGLKTVHKMGVAANGSNCMTDRDELCFEILHSGDSDTNASAARFLSTEEMLCEYRYLGEEMAREIVLDNPNAIAEMIENVEIRRNIKHPFSIQNAEEKLISACKAALHKKYGDSIPDIIRERYTSELDNILSHSFASYYLFAALLVSKSKSLGYHHIVRGCAGSSLISYLLGITEINPLPPHGYCLKCKQVAFLDPIKYQSGYDLNRFGEKRMVCRRCGEPLRGDGHNIPVEFFTGLDGEKAPAFSFNFASEIHRQMIDYAGEVAGKEKAYYAGTMGTLSLRLAADLEENYCREHSVCLRPDEKAEIKKRLTSVCRDEFHHPGGILFLPEEEEVFDHTPIRYYDRFELHNHTLPGTSLDYHTCLSALVKYDILSSNVLTTIKLMEEMTGTSASATHFPEIDIHSFFLKDRYIGIPFIFPYNAEHFRCITSAIAPDNFSDLVSIYGFVYGTNAWEGNAERLITAGIERKNLIAYREDVMMTLMRHGIERMAAFDIAERVRNGKGGKCLTAEQEAMMRKHDIPDWTIDSMKKISYLFPKAHAAEYAVNCLRMIWYKIYHPAAFYAAVLSTGESAFDYNILAEGQARIEQELSILRKKVEPDYGIYDGNVNDEIVPQIAALELALECCERGIVFLPADIMMSDPRLFTPENGAIRIPYTQFSQLK